AGWGSEGAGVIVSPSTRFRACGERGRMWSVRTPRRSFMRGERRTHFYKPVVEWHSEASDGDDAQMLSRCRFLQGFAATALILVEAEAAGLFKTQLRALRAAVRGRVVARGDTGYDAVRVVFNRRWDGIRSPVVVQVR